MTKIKVAPDLDAKALAQSAYITKYGKTQLTIGLLPIPTQIPPNHVLIKVHAVALQPADVKIRNGSLKVIKGSPSPKTPCILGYDCSGVIEQVASNTSSSWTPGERVCCVAVEGALTSHVVVHEKYLAKLPDEVGFVDAAALVTAGLTGWQAFEYARKYFHEESFGGGSFKKVLITGGAGGVGHIAIQLAKKVFGAEIVVTTASSGKQDFVRECGADVVVNYRSEDFVRAINDNVNLLRCDFALDCTGETKKCKKVVKKGSGCIVGVLGIPDGAMLKQVVDVYDMARPPGCVFGLLNCISGCSVCGSGVHVHNMITLPFGQQLQELCRLVGNGTIKVNIDKIFPLKRANEAFDYVGEGHVMGKVVVELVESG
ncbi:chaperonin 10-like protein [Obelidium mucronatum]|nr:chaperonin 10-like protein [Obelidium mucronatum]